MKTTKLAAILATVATTLSLTVLIPGTATAAPCAGTYTLGVGGVGGGTSTYFAAQQPVGYSAQPIWFSIDEGVNELNRLYDTQRAQCPGQHVKVIGHSNGAAVAATWLSRAFRPNTNGILLGNPKRDATGISRITLLPNGGTVWNYHGAPVLDVCQVRDPICNFPAGPSGYFDGTHQAYQYDVNGYGDYGFGMVWVG